MSAEDPRLLRPAGAGSPVDALWLGLPAGWRGPVIGPGIADWEKFSESDGRRLDLTGLPVRIARELAWMAHWQAMDGTRSSVLAMNQLANILRRAIAEHHPFPGSILDMDWDTAAALQGWFYSVGGRADVEDAVADVDVVVVDQRLERTADQERRDLRTQAHGQVDQQRSEGKARRQFHQQAAAAAVIVTVFGGLDGVAGGEEAFDLPVLVGIRVEVDLAVSVVGEELPACQFLADRRPGSRRADLAQVEHRLHGEDHRVDQAHAPHAHDRGVEPLIVLLQPVLGMARPVGVAVGDAVAGLDPIHGGARPDDVERADQIRQGPVFDARSMGGGRDHPGDRLTVEASHVGQGEL